MKVIENVVNIVVNFSLIIYLHCSCFIVVLKAFCSSTLLVLPLGCGSGIYKALFSSWWLMFSIGSTSKIKAR